MSTQMHSNDPMPALKKNSQISVRIPDVVHDELKRLAEDDHRSLASYIALVLTKHVEAKRKK
jgi:hypothetical protein